MDDLITGAGNRAQSAPDSAPGPNDYRPLGSGELADPWELGEFFEALGPVMRLPPKEAESPPGRAALFGGARGRRTTILVWAALAVVAGAAGASPLRRALESSLPMPSELHGVWTTTADRYADRSFELSAISLRLGLGSADATYPISHVGRRDSSGAAIYTIRYRDGENTLDFALAIGPDSLARIRNLPGVGWRKMRR